MSTRTTYRIATPQERESAGYRTSGGCVVADFFGTAWDAVSGVVAGGVTAGMVPGCGPANVWVREHETVLDSRRGFGIVKPLLAGAAFFVILWLGIRAVQ